MIYFDRSGTRTRRWLRGAAAMLLAASLAGCEVGSAVISGAESVGDWVTGIFDGEEEGKDKAE